MAESFIPQEAVDLCVVETKNCYVSWENGTRRWRAKFWLDEKGVMHCGYMRNDFLSGDRPDSEKIRPEPFEKLLEKILNKRIFIDSDDTETIEELVALQQITDPETLEVSYDYGDKPRVILYAKACEILL